VLGTPRQPTGLSGSFDFRNIMSPPEQFSPVAAGDAVRDFYDRYPYPTPVDDLEDYKRRWDESRRRADFHLFWPWRAYRDDPSILVAGCGTLQAARHAMRWPNAQVTAIDCSATSVKHTAHLKQQHDLENLEIRQLPVEQVAELGMTFDQIVCTGVLHHLADPVVGLRALRSVLKPDGVMQLMVYAPYGRSGIYMLQDFCRRVGIHATDQDIRDLNHALGALPPGHPLQTLISQAQVPDLQTEAGLADALVHPRDRAYSVPQLFEFLEKGEVAFGRWLRQAPYSVHCGVIAKIPQAARIRGLPPAERFAAIELFRGTMARHTVVAYRSDSEDCHRQLGVDGESWLACVPIRMPDTICVEERLPIEAAAVLINRSHIYRDIFMPISPREKKWFSAIDGVRRISDIVERTRSQSDCGTDLEAARNFFERLWWHDQVVFDTSHRADAA
jgi:SAM-dependent methyltransferase